MREGGQEEGRAKRRDDEGGWPETLGGLMTAALVWSV